MRGAPSKQQCRTAEIKGWQVKGCVPGTELKQKGVVQSEKRHSEVTEDED